MLSFKGADSFFQLSSCSLVGPVFSIFHNK